TTVTETDKNGKPIRDKKGNPITRQNVDVSFTNKSINNKSSDCNQAIQSQKGAGNSTGCGLNSGPSGLGAIWLIVLAVLEDLLRVAGFVAVVMVIVGGIRYTVSSGDPQATSAAKGTLINALIGLTIAIVASATVAFIAGVIG
ncbi:MAG: pilin, partial [Candidatus Saccharimonadales bacterium]